MGFGFFCVFLEMFAVHTSILATWTPVRFHFLTKIPKNCYVFLDAFFTVLWYFYMLRWTKNMCANFSFDLYILCILCEISCMIFEPIQCHMISMLVVWFCDNFCSWFYAIITVWVFRSWFLVLQVAWMVKKLKYAYVMTLCLKLPCNSHSYTWNESLKSC